MICILNNFKKKNYSWRSRVILTTFKGGPNCERTLKIFCTKLLLSWFVRTTPTYMYIPITYCWVVICDHIDTRISVSYKWDGEGFWEIFCVRQVVQNPQVLGGWGEGSDMSLSIISQSKMTNLTNSVSQYYLIKQK